MAAIPDGLIDHGVVPRIHPSVFKALGQSVELQVPLTASGREAAPKALGVVETYSGVSILQAADVAAKAASVTLVKIHLAMALGGKAYLMMAGSVMDVQAAVDAGGGSCAGEGAAGFGGRHSGAEPRVVRRIHLTLEWGLVQFVRQCGWERTGP